MIEFYVKHEKHGREDIKFESLRILFFSIRARDASKSDLSRVAKSVSSMHQIVAALGFYIINANSPKVLPDSKIETSLIFF